MAATASQFDFRFRFSWVRSFVKVEIYLRTKFRRNISIHGWDITTSGFWKQTSPVLEFYFRFQFLRLRHHRHVIIHLPTKFRPNRTIGDRVMTPYPFFNMTAVSHIELSQDYCKVTGPIWTKFGRQMQNDMPMVTQTYKSEPEVEFQHGGPLFPETGSCNVSAADWYITPKFGMHYAGRLRPSQMSEVTKTETGSRTPMPWRHLEKWMWRHQSVANGFIWTKFGRQMESDMYAEPRLLDLHFKDALHGSQNSKYHKRWLLLRSIVTFRQCAAK